MNFETKDIFHMAASDELKSSSPEVRRDIKEELNMKGDLIGIEILNDSAFIWDLRLESVQAKMMQFSNVQSG